MASTNPSVPGPWNTETPGALNSGISGSGAASANPPYFRVGGWYTRFMFGGVTLAFCDVIRETAPQPVARPQAVQPMDQPYPVEITFPMALQAGSLDLQIRELWANEVWYQLDGINKGPFSQAQDLLGVFQANLVTTLNSGPISCSKTILFPSGGARQITYHGCVVTNVQLDEQVSIDTMTIPKTITIMYLQRTEQNYVANSSSLGSAIL